MALTAPWCQPTMSKLSRLLLLIAILAVINEVVARKSGISFKGIGKSSSSSSSVSRTRSSAGASSRYTYSSSSVRNYNSGSRYYVRRSTIATSRNSFGYTYYLSGRYYLSDYGYRMYYPPNYYAPVYVGTSYYYYPPMFVYYYRSQSRYWDKNRPRYVCRNDNAFWPLENQTNEFVDGKPPSVNFAVYDLEFSDSLDDAVKSNVSIFSQSGTGDNLIELSSLDINQLLFDGFTFENFTDGHSNWTGALNLTTDVVLTILTTSSVINVGSKKALATPSEKNKRLVLAYNYFACPDGKDPEETYCCGTSTAQYCCVYEEYTSTQTLSWGIVVAAVISLLLFVCVSASVMHKIRRRLCPRGHRGPAVIVTEPSETALVTHTVSYQPANQNEVRFDGSQKYPPPPPGYPAYQPTTTGAVPTPYQPVTMPQYPPSGGPTASYPSAVQQP